MLIFTGVCDSVHSGGGGGAASVHAGILHQTPGPGRSPPPDQAGTPRTRQVPPSRPGRHLPGPDRHPIGPGRYPARTRHTPSPHWSRAYWEIRSTSRWYASYWNAILSFNCFWQKFHQIIGLHLHLSDWHRPFRKPWIR